MLKFETGRTEVCRRWRRNACVTLGKKNAGLPCGKSGMEKVIRLAAKFELTDDRCVAIEVLALQVIEKLTTTSCHCDQAAA